MLMKTIWKYAVPLVMPDDPATELELPAGAQVLHVGVQGPAEVTFWAWVDPLASLEKRRFKVYGTGWLVPASGMTYLGTAMVYGTSIGDIVWHLFEVKRPS